MVMPSNFREKIAMLRKSYRSFLVVFSAIDERRTPSEIAKEWAIDRVNLYQYNLIHYLSDSIWNSADGKEIRGVGLVKKFGLKEAILKGQIDWMMDKNNLKETWEELYKNFMQDEMGKFLIYMLLKNQDYYIDLFNRNKEIMFSLENLKVLFKDNIDIFRSECVIFLSEIPITIPLYIVMEEVCRKKRINMWMELSRTNLRTKTDVVKYFLKILKEIERPEMPKDLFKDMTDYIYGDRTRHLKLLKEVSQFIDFDE